VEHELILGELKDLSCWAFNVCSSPRICHKCVKSSQCVGVVKTEGSQSSFVWRQSGRSFKLKTFERKKMFAWGWSRAIINVHVSVDNAADSWPDCTRRFAVLFLYLGGICIRLLQCLYTAKYYLQYSCTYKYELCLMALCSVSGRY